MSLVRAEVRRLAKRRFTRWMLVVMLLVLGIVVVSISASSKQHTPARVAAAEAAAQAEYREGLAQHQRYVAACEATKKSGGPDASSLPADCGKDSGPLPEQFEARWHLPFQFVFKDLFGVFISVLFGVLALFGYLIGASYVGAEWNSGGMTNLLLWRPKRLPVLLSKLGVLLGGVTAVGLTLAAVWTLAFWLIGRYDGLSGKMTAGVWQSFALSGLRGLGLALAVAAVGFGLASIGRHTAMALGIAVGLGVVGEIGVRGGLELAGVAFPGRFVLSTYVMAWFEKSHTMFDYNACAVTLNEGCEPGKFVVAWPTSALVLGLGTALVLAATIWTMRSRGIT